jgi:lipopolysaccharide assembly outer membrane protein LptD (OstA)
MTHLKGNVEIATGRGVILRAEQADYNSNTGVVAARGNVRMTRQGNPTVRRADEVEFNVSTGDVKARVGKAPQPPK